jgi:hypothetical protein
MVPPPFPPSCRLPEEDPTSGGGSISVSAFASTVSVPFVAEAGMFTANGSESSMSENVSALSPTAAPLNVR